MKVLISYLSYSMNTKEVAEMIAEELRNNGCQVDMYEIGFESYIPEMDKYDLNLVGTFTWEKGATPDEMKEFIIDVGYKPENVEVFGTGDTQFGGDALFCNAVSKLEKFYGSKNKGLKIEQSPRDSQEEKVYEWARNLVKEQVLV